MITEWHLKRGFSTIGYHYFIKSDGAVERGRAEEEVGAHCEGHNARSIGICLAGLTRFSDPQFKALRNLLGELKQRYPHATLHGHREFNPSKTCPVYVYDHLVQAWKDAKLEEKSQWKTLLQFCKLFLRLLGG